jgi:branched-subunit amino acid aminotransferase/4-amino-4-deoxychorismate lyase
LRARHGAGSRIEALLTSGKPNHTVRETPTANFVAVIDGVLMSPPRSTILDGISLRMIEELSTSLGMPFVEREIPLAEIIASAQECLLANTSYCVAPVTKIIATGLPSGEWNSPYTAEQTIRTGKSLFRRIISSWSNLVGVDILRQFRSKP